MKLVVGESVFFVFCNMSPPNLAILLILRCFLSVVNDFAFFAQGGDSIFSSVYLYLKCILVNCTYCHICNNALKLFVNL